MRNRLLMMLMTCAALVASCGSDEPADAEQMLTQRAVAEQLAQRFVGTLKPLLKRNLQENGAVATIEVCASEAPKIADRLSVESGWLVRRVSLKSRNATRGTPDAWERDVLEDFSGETDEASASGPLSRDGVVRGHYRFMLAQRTEAVCLLCHGEALQPEVAAVLGEYYPQDLATGYTLGEVRGAISLIAPAP